MKNVSNIQEYEIKHYILLRIYYMANQYGGWLGEFYGITVHGLKLHLKLRLGKFHVTNINKYSEKKVDKCRNYN